MIPDPLDAVVDYLRSDPGVRALAGLRVYPAELTASEAVSMPRYAAVVTLAGGIGQANRVPIRWPRMDVTCYGATPKQARELFYVVDAALVALSRDVRANALLNSVVQSAGPIQGRTPDEHWPMAWGSYIVSASTIPIE